MVEPGASTSPMSYPPQKRRHHDEPGSFVKRQKLYSTSDNQPHSSAGNAQATHNGYGGPSTAGWKYCTEAVRRSTPYPDLPPILDQKMEKGVFTHQSASMDNNYERLEWLGDAYLELMATRVLYAGWPHLDVGQSSRIREYLVQNNTLAEYALSYKFDKKLWMAPNDHIRENSMRKIYGDVFEAYVAAAVLSNPTSGYALVEQWMTNLWQPILQNNDVAGRADEKDYPSKMNLDLLYPAITIEYEKGETVRRTGYHGEKVYSVSIYLTGKGYEKEFLGTGSGAGHIQAKQAAAKDAVHRNLPVYQAVAAFKHQYMLETTATTLQSRGVDAGKASETQLKLETARAHHERSKEKIEQLEKDVADAEQKYQKAETGLERDMADASRRQQYTWRNKEIKKLRQTGEKVRRLEAELAEEAKTQGEATTTGKAVTDAQSSEVESDTLQPPPSKARDESLMTNGDDHASNSVAASSDSGLSPNDSGRKKRKKERAANETKEERRERRRLRKLQKELDAQQGSETHEDEGMESKKQKKREKETGKPRTKEKAKKSI